MDYSYETLFLEMGLGESIAATALNAISFDPAGSYGIDLWMKLSDCNTTKTILYKEGVFSLSVIKDKVQFSAQGYPTVAAEVGISPNVWTHVALSCFQKDVRIFLDGVVVAQMLVTGTGRSESKPVQIGKDFFGALRLLRVYKSALATQDVADMMYQNTATSEMTVFYDFTQNPPRELVGKGQVTLPATCTVMQAMPAARYGRGAYLDVSQDEDVNPAGKRNKPYTVQLWARPDAVGAEQLQTLFYNADTTGTVGLELLLIKSGTGYQVSASHGPLEKSSSQVTAAQVILPQQWVNVAVTWESKTLKLYLNGTKAAELTAEPLAVALTEKTTLIGAKAARYKLGGVNCFQGCLSRVDVWDKALTPTQLAAFSAQEPDWNAEGLTGSWSLFSDCLANRVDARPMSRQNSLAVVENLASAKVGQVERHQPLLQGAPEPLTIEQLEECRRRALAGDGLFSAETGALRVNTCRVDGTVYFVLHSEKCSYTACSLSEAELGDDPMVEWALDLILILLGALISLLFSSNLAYNTQLGTYLRLQIANSPKILLLLDMVKDASSVVSFIVSLLQLLVSENKIWQLLTLCVKVSFWGIVSGLTRLMAKIFGGPASWAAWLLLTGGAILYHLSKKPKKIPAVVITSILFNHRQPGSICSINIRKNETQTWARPEWQPATAHMRVPAVYRIARFNTPAASPLQIAVEFASSDTTLHTVTIRGVAVAPNPTLLGDTNAVAVTLTNGASGQVMFSLPTHTLGAANIRCAHFAWQWQYQTPSGWVVMDTTDHKVYTILDSVQAPWSTLPNQRNNLWTDCLDIVMPWVMGLGNAAAVMAQLTQHLYNSPNVRYNGFSPYSASTVTNGVRVYYFQLTTFMMDWASAPAITDMNCEDCCAFMIVFSNALGCSLRRAALGNNFDIPPILLIGETLWRQPAGGHFDYHAVACLPLIPGAGRDPTQYQVYDPCLQYHNPAGAAVLAQGVQMSQYVVVPAVVPIVPPPAPGFYREDLVSNTPTGLPNCTLLDVVDITL